MISRRRVKKPSFLRRFLVFILAMLLGMALLVGAVAGGIYAALAYVSLDTLETVGVDVGDGILTEDSLLRELSVLGLISEIADISGRLSSLTINTLISEYGVILSEEVRAMLPAAVLDLPLSDLTGPGALDVILENTTFGDILPYIGEDAFPEAVRLKVSDRPLIHVAKQDFAALFAGVYLGDFIGVQLSVADDGTATPDFEEGEEETLTAYLGAMSLGEYFSAEDGNTVIQATLERTPLDSFVEATEGNVIASAIKGKMLGDLLKLEEGAIVFSADSLTEGLCLGDALSYTKREDGLWYDENNEEAAGIYRELVGLSINGLTGDAIMDAVDNVYLAELMDYKRREVGKDNKK